MKDPKETRIIYMGTPEFAVAPLKALHENGYNVCGVVTVPDKPAGRGRKISESPVKVFATENGIECLQPLKLKDPEFLSRLKELDPDIIIVVAFRMLPKEVWQMPELGTFNLHASLLPQYRGAAPINYAVINGETESGLTTFLIDEKIDTGNILLKEVMPIAETETAGELHDRMMPIGAQLVIKTVDGLTNNTIEPLKQDTTEVLKDAPKIFKEDMRIDWSKPIHHIYNHIRGLSPYPAAFFALSSDTGKEYSMKVFRSHIDQNGPKSDVPKIYTDSKSYLGISLKDGVIFLDEVQLSGKKRMKIEDFLRGFQINEGFEPLN